MSDIQAHARGYLARIRRERETTLRSAREVRAALELALQALATAFGVRRARIFGSLVWGGFDPRRSDVDVLVWGLEEGSCIELAAALWERLERPAHVVHAETAPASLLARVDRDGEELNVGGG